MSGLIPDTIIRKMRQHCRPGLLSRQFLFSILALGILASGLVWAAAPPTPLVLVLKLVSADRVQPTTGVVVSADGHVVVSADFVNEGDEIVVMDGGTDILTHARPAKLIARSESSGLAVLSVQNMFRPAIRLATLTSPKDGDLHLAAFPPAAQLAEGNVPLWLPLDVRPGPLKGEWKLNNLKSLPNVNGLVMDNCGNMAGMVLANGPQSLEKGQSKPMIGASLKTALQALDVTLAAGNCDTRAFSELSPEEQARQSEPAATTAPAPLERQPQQIDRDPIEPKSSDTQATAVTESAPAVGDQTPVTDDGASQVAVQPAKASAPSVWSLIPVWLWLLIAALLGALMFKLGTLWRLVNRIPETVDNSAPRHAPVVEPPTKELLAGSSSAPYRIGVLDDPMPDINALPAGFDAVVSISGQFGNGKSFSRHCVVEQAHIDIIIGRGEVDISIESPMVSRQHARLKGTASSLTFSDLGSGNGTFIGAIPCLPGEIMFIQPNDEISLADVHFRVSVKVTGKQPS